MTEAKGGGSVALVYEEREEPGTFFGQDGRYPDLYLSHNADRYFRLQQ